MYQHRCRKIIESGGGVKVDQTVSTAWACLYGTPTLGGGGVQRRTPLKMFEIRTVKWCNFLLLKTEIGKLPILMQLLVQPLLHSFTWSNEQLLLLKVCRVGQLFMIYFSLNVVNSAYMACKHFIRNLCLTS